MNETQLEKEIQDKGLVAPRITPDHINALITDEVYWNPDGTTLTICVIKVKNGSLLVGESACASPENFDAEIGKKRAFENARNQLWKLEGYLLREKLSVG